MAAEIVDNCPSFHLMSCCYMLSPNRDSGFFDTSLVRLTPVGDSGVVNRQSIFALYKLSLYEYVVQTFGWDESFQQRPFRCFLSRSGFVFGRPRTGDRRIRCPKNLRRGHPSFVAASTTRISKSWDWSQGDGDIDVSRGPVEPTIDALMLPLQRRGDALLSGAWFLPCAKG